MTVEQQTRDAQAVARGDKPLAIIERVKAPETYTAYLRLLERRAFDSKRGVFVVQRMGQEGLEILVAANAGVYRQYIALLHCRARYTRKAYQGAMGKLLGYDIDDIQAWYGDPTSMSCECSKCGGEVTAHDRLEHDAWLARTQSHKQSVYVSNDDCELDSETAAQYAADRERDDIAAKGAE